ncbi:MAG: hypothetical protein H7Z21_17840, partial [Hymenobacter sp.]|nr:hypothetical protein [Hymenobacter sp.]
MRTTLRLAAFMVVSLALVGKSAWAQTATNKAAPIIPKSFGATSIKALGATAATGASGALQRFRILTLPTKGTLLLGATPITGPTNIAIADQGNLRYDPDATASSANYSFTYQAEFANVVTGPATFSLPVSNADCGQNSAVDFSERTVGENWKAQTGVTIGNTTVSTSKYNSSVPGGQTNILEISNQPARLSTQGLVWQLDNEGVAGNNVATVELNFSRPVRNLAFSMEDIDISTLALGGSDFVDEVTFNAYTLNGTTPYQLAVADVALGSNNSNRLVAGTNTIQGITTNSGPDGTVVLTYPVGIAISRLEIIYRNTQTYVANNLRLQTIEQSLEVYLETERREKVPALVATLESETPALAAEIETLKKITPRPGLL